MATEKPLTTNTERNHRRRMWLAEHIGRRGAFLLFLAILDFVYGYSLIFPLSLISPSLEYIASIAPLQLWGALWVGTGLICFAFAFRKYDAWGYAAAMLLKVLWAGTFLLGWAFRGLERGYLAALVWGGFALILTLISTWPEPTRITENGEIE